MTEAQFRRRVTYWQEKLAELQLTNWRNMELAFVENPDGNDRAAAAITPSLHYDSFRLEVSTSWLAQADDIEIDEVIIHELIHLVMRNYHGAAHMVLDELSPQARVMWGRLLEHEQEVVIERIALTIAHAYKGKVVR